MERKWLLTIAADQLTEATERLRRLGCTVAPEAAVPMEDDTVLSVSGPEEREPDLAVLPGVKAVHPDSDFTLG